MQAFKLSANTKQDGSSPLQNGGCRNRYFQKELQILTHLTTEQFSALPRSILNELWPREDGSVYCYLTVVSGSRMVFSLHDRAVSCISGCHGELCLLTGISVFLKC